jgi:hypothetical protein
MVAAVNRVNFLLLFLPSPHLVSANSLQCGKPVPTNFHQISIQFLPRASPPSCEAVISPLRSVIPSFTSGRTPPGSASSAPISASASDAHRLHCFFPSWVYRGQSKLRTCLGVSTWCAIHGFFERGAGYTENARSVTRHLVRRSEFLIAFIRKADPLALLLGLTTRETFVKT